MSAIHHGLRWGLITAAVLVALGLVSNLTGAHGLPGASWVFYAVPVILLFVAQRRFLVANGSRTYGQGMQVAVGLLLPAAMVYSLFVFSWNSFVDDEVIQAARARVEANSASTGDSAAELEQQEKVFNVLFSPAAFAMVVFVQITLLGGIGALVLSAIGRKPAPS